MDCIGGVSEARYGAMGEELRMEGELSSIGFNGAKGSPCKFLHIANVCRCIQQVHHVCQGEVIFRVYAWEDNERIISGVSGFRRQMGRPGENESAKQHFKR